MSEPQPSPTKRRPLIWIVDDNATEAMIVERSLGAAYDFERFVDGSVVVERLGTGAPQPDLVLLDWVMPGIAGDEVCRFLRTDPRTVELPIILITASRLETADIANGLASGANDYVGRPFATEELRARVDSAIRARRLSDLVQQKGRRLATINRLGGALFGAGTNIPRILEELAMSLTVSLCHGCSISLVPGTVSIAPVTRYRGNPSDDLLAALAHVSGAIAHEFPLASRDRLRGIVTVTRDRGAALFDEGDLVTIATCIEYASLAIESAMRFDAERAAELAVNAERDRIAQFQQEMLGIVGHDLRAPLGAIRIGTEMLAAKADPLSASVVQRIDSCAKRMTRMIDQLLDMTRVRLGGGIPVARQRTPLVPIIKSVIDELSLAHKGAKFELVGDTDVVGLWDPDRLAQVASNLLGNALHYGRADAPIVVEVTQAGGAAKMSVHNALRGEPLRPEAIATLFEPYRRGEDNERHGNGLGLGLYIVTGIVKAHGGTIEVESSLSGTTFRVVLPTSREDQRDG